MGTTLQEISQHLDHLGWPYGYDDDQDCLVTSVMADNADPFLIAIDLDEEGDYLCVTAPELLIINDHPHKQQLWKTLLAIAWEAKLLCWVYDPETGELSARIAMTLEGASLTAQQLQRLLSAITNLIDREAMPRIRTVLATGRDPGRVVLV